jgi:peptide/nickel transport system substrate-binding protein
VIEEWRRGESITLAYNPNWYGPEPSIKRVILRIIPETANMRLQLERGDVDMITGLSIPELMAMEGTPGITILEAPSMLLILAYLNNTKPPLDDVRVRQAMNYAINYDQIIEQLIAGKGRRLRGPLAFGMEGYDETLVGYDYDPEKAKALLAEAGYPDGFDIVLTYSSQGAPGADDVALAAQADLAAVGINVEIERVAEPTRRERIDQSDFVWSVGGWSPSVPVPTFTMEAWYLCERRGISANRAFYCNEEVDALVKEAAVTVDAAERIAKYQEAQRIMVEEAPYILFYQANQLLAVSDRVEGIELKVAGSQFQNYERLSKQ